jgi:hypothetical protein
MAAKGVNEQRNIKPVECDRDRAGIKFWNKPLCLMLFNLLADCIVECSQKIGPGTLEPLVGRGCFRHCP